MNILYTFNNQQTTKQFSDLLKEATYTILYFYPKDDTPGCTIEAKDFADHSDKFRLLNAQIVGVSKDNHKSHCKFQEKYGLSFGLISDPDFALHEQF
jgi:peroxiredoxin Q/BCP